MDDARTAGEFEQQSATGLKLDARVMLGGNALIESCIPFHASEDAVSASPRAVNSHDVHSIDGAG